MNVLFVCTQGMQRSPTAADVFKELAEKKGIEADVKYAGTSPTARTRVTSTVLKWADRIYVMEERHRKQLLEIHFGAHDKIVNLNIPDMYNRDHPKLVEILKKKLEKEIKN